MPKGTKREPLERDAFLFGIVGAVIALLLYFVALLLSFCTTPGSSLRSTALLFILIPLAAAFPCSAAAALLRPSASKITAPLGYACVWGLLALPVASDERLVLFLLLFAGAVFVTGYLGQAAVRLYDPHKFARTGSPGEPRCPRCGYVLYYVHDHLCPDCGQPFLSADIDMRLAHWENGILQPKPAQDAGDPSQEERPA